jgi:hypothetical protein
MRYYLKFSPHIIFNYMHLVLDKSEGVKCPKTGDKKHYLSMLFSKRARNPKQADSLKKLGHLSKKHLNSYINNSCELSPERQLSAPESAKNSYSRTALYKYHTDKDLERHPGFFKHRLLTEPYESDEEFSDGKEGLVMSTECSHHSSQFRQQRGKCVQEYHLVKLIGRGKFGQVFLAVYFWLYLDIRGPDSLELSRSSKNKISETYPKMPRQK